MTTVVGGREGHRRAARGSAVIAESREVVVPGHATAIVAGHGSTVVGKPAVQCGHIVGTATATATAV